MLTLGVTSLGWFSWGVDFARRLDSTFCAARFDRPVLSRGVRRDVMGAAAFEREGSPGEESTHKASR